MKFLILVTSFIAGASWISFINIISPIYHSVFRLISSFLPILNTNFPSFSVYSFLQYEFLSAQAVPWRVLLLKRKLKFWKIFHTYKQIGSIYWNELAIEKVMISCRHKQVSYLKVTLRLLYKAFYMELVNIFFMVLWNFIFRAHERCCRDIYE